MCESRFQRCLVRLDSPCDDIHQRRFTCAVAANDADAVFGAKFVGEVFD